MPRDLFTAGGPDTHVRGRRSSVFIVSFAVHLVAIAAVVVATLLLPDVLPRPHASIAYAVEGPRQVRLTDIALPAPVPGRARSAPALESAAPVPVDAPHGITEESSAAGTAAASEPRVSDVVVGVGDGTGLVTGTGLDAVPPPPTAPPTQPVRLHAGIEPPRKLNDVTPLYPPLARAAGVRGVVIIEATIDGDGVVVAARVLRSVPMLDEAALAAVRRWRYAPARLNGVPAAVLITVTVNFTLP